MKLHHLRAIAHEICPVGRPAFAVAGDADFEVDDELARSLLEQTDNYGPADEASTALLSEIRSEAAVVVDRMAEARAAVQAAEDALATARAEQDALNAPEAAAAPPASRGRRRSTTTDQSEE